MTRNTVRSAIIVAMMTLVLAPAAFAADQTDIGTADKANLDKVFPTKPAYSPYAGRNFPTRPLLRRHAPAHRVLDGCGRVRGAPRRPATPIASRGARRSPRTAASRSSCRGRSTSWSWPITPTAWASSRS